VGGPAGNRTTGHVARADREIDPFGLDGADQLRQHRRVVGQVGVHLDEHVVAPLEPPSEARPVGRTKAGLGRSAQHLDRAEAGGGSLGEVGRAVGAAIVDHQDVASGTDARTSSRTSTTFSAS
jgi:hypothetical protein